MIKHGSFYRPDIDGLRAIAVWLVVLYHAFPHAIQGGFIGVDVFFVISGFLITKLLVEDHENARYSILDFYSRRIRRIFPALLVVLVATYAIGWFALFDYELVYIGTHVMAGILFLSNFRLWSESGYFDSAADTKPLLHLWSLSIEEQFYLVWPLLLYLFYRSIGPRRRSLFVATAVVATASFATNIYLSKTNPVADFFFPVSRAWELLAGSLLALAPSTLVRENRFRSLLGIGGLAAILAGGILIRKSDGLPGWLALLPVLGTIAILSSRNSWFHARILSNRVLVWFGLISYPFYLWHWPFFTYIRLWDGGSEASPWIFAGAISLAIVLAWLTMKLIENPIRFGGGSKKLKVASLLATAAVMVGLAYSNNFYFHGFPDRLIASRVKKYDGALEWQFVKTYDCEKVYGQEPTGDFCVASSEHPEVFLLGDSHANEWVPGLVNQVSFINAGNGAPIDALVTIDGTHSKNVESFEKSKTFIRSAKNSLKVVVLSAAWDVLANGNDFADWLEGRENQYDLVSPRPEEANLPRIEKLERSLSRTIEFIQGEGLKVVLTAALPEIPFQPMNCYRNVFAEKTACRDWIPRGTIMKRQEATRGMFTRILKTHPGVLFFDPVVHVCEAEKCPYFDTQGYPLYRDQAHMGVMMARPLGQRLAVGLRQLL